MHPNETQNRLAKAKRLRDFILARNPNITPTVLNLTTEAQWALWATALGEKEPPSALTIAQVVALVEGRNEAIEAIRSQVGKVR